jgi:hypothetical protein
VAALIPASTLGALLIPALQFVVPSSEVSLARIWGLGARRAGKFTVVASIVRLLQSSADDGVNAMGNCAMSDVRGKLLERSHPPEKCNERAPRLEHAASWNIRELNLSGTAYVNSCW